MNKIKVLIADASLFMRKTISAILSKEKDIEIIGVVKNGREAIDMAENLSPDTIVMNADMPIMDGITALEIIMKNNPIPVIIISTLTKEGADATLKALNLGALDFIVKDNHSLDNIELERNLADKVRKCAANKNRLAHVQDRQYNILDVFQDISTTPKANTLENDKEVNSFYTYDYVPIPFNRSADNQETNNLKTYNDITIPASNNLENNQETNSLGTHKDITMPFNHSADNQETNHQETNPFDTYGYVSIPFNRNTDTKSNNHNDDIIRKVTNTTGAKRVVAIGSSTGGPQSLQKVIPLLPQDIGVPIVVTQHMPKNFTQSFVARLNQLSKLEVIEVAGGERLVPNIVYVAQGGYHLKFKKIGASVYTEIDSNPSDAFNIPSVDIMIDSIISIYGKECLGVIMTGMGNDGYKSLNKLKNMGGTIIAQNKSTCIVYGMPKAVIDDGIADEIVPLDEIASRIIYHVK